MNAQYSQVTRAHGLEPTYKGRECNQEFAMTSIHTPEDVYKTDVSDQSEHGMQESIMNRT